MRRDSDTINTYLSVCTKGGDDIEKKTEKKKQRREPKEKKNQEQREERLKRGGEGEHCPVGACTVTFAFAG